ncbi:hypothetical protein D0Z03_001120 [Geotrichum reessii]|nr:hypothetical protein D0Z03_001120 [Galactomyces reessii]
MSLLNALEEERLMIVEEQERKLKEQQQHQYGTPALVISSTNSHPGTPGSANRSRSSSRRPTSMLLDSNGGFGPEPTEAMFHTTSRSPSRSRPSGPLRTTSTSNLPISSYAGGVSLTPQRSAPSTNLSGLKDPYLDGTSYYYKSANLRPTISSTSNRESSATREKEKSSSFFKFWKSSNNNNKNRSRSASRNGSTTSINGTARSPSVDREKLLLSQNAQAIASGFASLSPSTTPVSQRPKLSGRSQSYSSMLSPLDSSTLSPQTSAPRSTSAQPARDTSAERSSSVIRESTGTSSDRRLVDDDEDGTSSEEEDSSDDSSDEEDSDTETQSSPVKVSAAKKAVKSLLESAAEEERPKQAHKVQSLLDVPIPGAVPPPSMAEYAAYKRRIIHPNTAFDNDGPDGAPYTATTEEFLDAKHAAKLPFEISTVHSNLSSKRMIRTMSRGDNIPSLTDPDAKRPKTFVLGTDLSPESAHALEWTIGTVLRDTNLLYVVCAYEDEIANGTSNNITPQQQEEDRMEAMTELTTLISKLLKKTRLQVQVIIEIIHCKSPKHLLTAVIDYVDPTMVILGSRGRSALKGVLLGSFSNYIVERSSVPVMVARRKLQKTKHKDLNVRLANNLRAHTGLEHAIVD